MSQPESSGGIGTPRLLVFGLVAVIIVLGLALVMLVVGRAGTPATQEVARVDALANSTDECVTCHRRTTAGIVEQYGHSTMAAAQVACQDCHEVAADYPSAVEHEAPTSSAPPPRLCASAATNKRWPSTTRAVTACQPTWPFKAPAT